MARLHAKYFKIVAANGDLDAASEISLANNAVNVMAEGVMVEHTITTNPSPVERYEIGTRFSVKGTLAYDDDTYLTSILGGSLTSSVYTKQQGIRTLADKDIRIGIYRHDGAIVLHDFTDVNFVPKFELAYEQGKRTYLPFEAVGTNTSEMTIDNSAA